MIIAGDRIYIFGAHSRGQSMAVYLKTINPEIVIEGFLVDDEDNDCIVDGIKVLHIEKNDEVDFSLPVYIATRGISHEKITKHLSEKGFKTIIPITPSIDTEVRNEFLRINFEKNGRKFIKIDDIQVKNKTYLSCTIFRIKSVFDCALCNEKSFESECYRKELQVGKALTDTKICEITDDMGANISNLNRQFCELTGLYWMWKNAKEDVVGLEHYRRHFILPKDWLGFFDANDIDVILPIPLYVGPTLAENYRYRHVGEDLEFVYNFFEKYVGSEAANLKDFMEKTSLYSPCNMFIMRKSVLNDLCTWLFPILFAVYEHVGAREDMYQNRYPGFLSERLITYYFEKNRDKYKLVYADKIFIS